MKQGVPSPLLGERWIVIPLIWATCWLSKSRHSNDEIKITSWNVRGMNSPLKRGKVYAHLRAHKSYIYFLQETHIKKKAAKILCPLLAPQVDQSNFSTKSRGVAIMIRKNIPFIHSQTISDQRGRYVIVSGTVNSIPLKLVNVYGPNFDDPLFFQNHYSALFNLSDSNVIMGGDFKYILDPVLDRQHSQTSLFRNSGTLNNLMQSYNLVDIWRLLHPTMKDFPIFPQYINPTLGLTSFVGF